MKGQSSPRPPLPTAPGAGHYSLATVVPPQGVSCSITCSFFSNPPVKDLLVAHSLSLDVFTTKHNSLFRVLSILVDSPIVFLTRLRPGDKGTSQDSIFFITEQGHVAIYTCRQGKAQIVASGTLPQQWGTEPDGGIRVAMHQSDAYGLIRMSYASLVLVVTVPEYYSKMDRKELTMFPVRLGFMPSVVSMDFCDHRLLVLWEDTEFKRYIQTFKIVTGGNWSPESPITLLTSPRQSTSTTGAAEPCAPLSEPYHVSSSAQSVRCIVTPDKHFTPLVVLCNGHTDIIQPNPNCQPVPSPEADVCFSNNSASVNDSSGKTVAKSGGKESRNTSSRVESGFSGLAGAPVKKRMQHNLSGVMAVSEVFFLVVRPGGLAVIPAKTMAVTGPERLKDLGDSLVFFFVVYSDSLSLMYGRNKNGELERMQQMRVEHNQDVISGLTSQKTNFLFSDCETCTVWEVPPEDSSKNPNDPNSKPGKKTGVRSSFLSSLSLGMKQRVAVKLNMFLGSILSPCCILNILFTFDNPQSIDQFKVSFVYQQVSLCGIEGKIQLDTGAWLGGLVDGVFLGSRKKPFDDDNIELLGICSGLEGKVVLVSKKPQVRCIVKGFFNGSAPSARSLTPTGTKVLETSMTNKLFSDTNMCIVDSNNIQTYEALGALKSEFLDGCHLFRNCYAIRSVGQPLIVSIKRVRISSDKLENKSENMEDTKQEEEETENIESCDRTFELEALEQMHRQGESEYKISVIDMPATLTKHLGTSMALYGIQEVAVKKKKSVFNKVTNHFLLNVLSDSVQLFDRNGNSLLDTMQFPCDVVSCHSYQTAPAHKESRFSTNYSIFSSCVMIQHAFSVIAIFVLNSKLQAVNLINSSQNSGGGKNENPTEIICCHLNINTNILYVAYRDKIDVFKLDYRKPGLIGNTDNIPNIDKISTFNTNLFKQSIQFYMVKYKLVSNCVVAIPITSVFCNDYTIPSSMVDNENSTLLCTTVMSGIVAYSFDPFLFPDRRSDTNTNVGETVSLEETKSSTLSDNEEMVGSGGNDSDNTVSEGECIKASNGNGVTGILSTDTSKQTRGTQFNVSTPLQTNNPRLQFNATNYQEYKKIYIATPYDYEDNVVLKYMNDDFYVIIDGVLKRIDFYGSSKGTYGRPEMVFKDVVDGVNNCIEYVEQGDKADAFHNKEGKPPTKCIALGKGIRLLLISNIDVLRSQVVFQRRGILWKNITRVEPRLSIDIDRIMQTRDENNNTVTFRSQSRRGSERGRKRLFALTGFDIENSSGILKLLDLDHIGALTLKGSTGDVPGSVCFCDAGLDVGETSSFKYFGVGEIPTSLAWRGDTLFVGTSQSTLYGGGVGMGGTQGLASQLGGIIPFQISSQTRSPNSGPGLGPLISQGGPFTQLQLSARIHQQQQQQQQTQGTQQNNHEISGAGAQVPFGTDEGTQPTRQSPGDTAPGTEDQTQPHTVGTSADSNATNNNNNLSFSPVVEVVTNSNLSGPRGQRAGSGRVTLTPFESNTNISEFITRDPMGSSPLEGARTTPTFLQIANPSSANVFSSGTVNKTLPEHGVLHLYGVRNNSLIPISSVDIDEIPTAMAPMTGTPSDSALVCAGSSIVNVTNQCGSIVMSQIPWVGRSRGITITTTCLDVKLKGGNERKKPLAICTGDILSGVALHTEELTSCEFNSRFTVSVCMTTSNKTDVIIVSDSARYVSVLKQTERRLREIAKVYIGEQINKIVPNIEGDEVLLLGIEGGIYRLKTEPDGNYQTLVSEIEKKSHTLAAYNSRNERIVDKRLL